MTLETRCRILRANALFLGLASLGGLRADVLGAFFGLGPQAGVLGTTPHAAIGFVEAHGLALIFAVLLWRAEPVRSWHLAAAAVHALLGVANLVFWPFFAAGDMRTVGYATTALHALFMSLELGAAAPRPRNARATLIAAF